MATLTLFIILILMVIYLVYGGIDLGLGILEFFLNKDLDRRHDLFIEHRQDRRYTFSHFLLLACGLAFLFSYPVAAKTLLNFILVPVLLLGIGIVIRIFFAYPLRKNRKVNAIISFWCTFWIGIIIGSVIQDSYDATIAVDYFQITPFTLFVALFVSALFAYQSAVFNISRSPTRLISAKYKKRAIVSNLLAVLFGTIILIIAFYYPEGITFYFLQDNISVSCMVISTLLLIPHWYMIIHDQKGLMRTVTVLQMSLIFFGVVAAQYPMIFQVKDEYDQIYTFHNSYSLEGSLLGIGIMLVAGIFYIVIRKKFPTWRKAH
jgi:cytochrome bd-type quinol oxidase subunit 2